MLSHTVYVYTIYDEYISKARYSSILATTATVISVTQTIGAHSLTLFLSLSLQCLIFHYAYEVDTTSSKLTYEKCINYVFLLLLHEHIKCPAINWLTLGLMIFSRRLCILYSLDALYKMATFQGIADMESHFSRYTMTIKHTSALMDGHE